MSSSWRCFMKKLALAVCVLAFFSGCHRETSSDVYDSQNFGEAVATYMGVVVEAKEVTVTNGEGLQDNTAGIIGGGLAGFLLGSTIGHGSGTAVAQVAGGLAGATGGAAIEQGLKTQQAMQYIIKLENDELKTVVQAVKPQLHVGQNVYLMLSNRGRSRVVAR